MSPIPGPASNSHPPSWESLQGAAWGKVPGSEATGLQGPGCTCPVSSLLMPPSPPSGESPVPSQCPSISAERYVPPGTLQTHCPFFLPLACD